MGRMPAWAKGQMQTCVYCGAWYPERDSRIKKRDGKWVCYLDYDVLLESERIDQIQRRKR